MRWPPLATAVQVVIVDLSPMTPEEMEAEARLTEVGCFEITASESDSEKRPAGSAAGVMRGSASRWLYLRSSGTCTAAGSRLILLRCSV